MNKNVPGAKSVQGAMEQNRSAPDFKKNTHYRHKDIFRFAYNGTILHCRRKKNSSAPLS